MEGYAQHYLGGVLDNRNYDAVSSTTNPLVTIANSYIYDHEGRKLKSWELITNGTTPPRQASGFA